MNTHYYTRAIRHCTNIFLALIILLGGIQTVQAQRVTLEVAGTSGVNIRACPELDCEVLGVALLGMAVQQTGAPEDGFTPVQFGSISGYAISVYLKEPGQDMWFREGEAGCNRVALIFDIGIGFEPSWSILDTLESTDTPATVFPMGPFAENQSEYLLRMQGLDLVIGTHGDASQLLTEMSDWQIQSDVETSIQSIEAVLGEDISNLHTPYAAGTNEWIRAIIAELGLMPVGWKIAAVDYGWDATEDGVYSDVVDRIYDGAIVEMHLDGPATAESTELALPRIIADLTEAGYTFVTVPEMMLPCSVWQS